MSFTTGVLHLPKSRFNLLSRPSNSVCKLVSSFTVNLLCFPLLLISAILHTTNNLEGHPWYAFSACYEFSERIFFSLTVSWLIRIEFFLQTKPAAVRLPCTLTRAFRNSGRVRIIQLASPRLESFTKFLQRSCGVSGARIHDRSLSQSIACQMRGRYFKDVIGLLN